MRPRPSLLRAACNAPSGPKCTSSPSEGTTICANVLGSASECPNSRLAPGESAARCHGTRRAAASCIPILQRRCASVDTSLVYDEVPGLDRPVGCSAALSLTCSSPRRGLARAEQNVGARPLPLCVARSSRQLICLIAAVFSAAGANSTSTLHNSEGVSVHG